MRPAGRFCGSARQSSAPSEFAQIFHTAVELLSLFLNHAFCSAPRIVCGGALRYGQSEPREAELKGIEEPVTIVSIDWR